MKTKGIKFIIVGVLGAILVATYDTIMGKPTNDITGPKSLVGFVISGILVIIGIVLLCKKPESSDE